MGYKIGIDVGGTFTDTVLIQNNEVIKKGKVLTDPKNILNTVLEAFDFLEIPPSMPLDHITVSTTLVTNAILLNKLSKVNLILFPGSGVRLSSFNWPVKYSVLSGELDYRGREVLPPDKREWKELTQRLSSHSENPLVAIVSKFSHRNNIFETELKAYLENEIPNVHIALGSEWGKSNFYRRSLTTYLNLACTELFSNFRCNLKKAVISRGFNGPIRILKADGGVFPLERIRPVESIYSGPAASILGALAQSEPEESFIVVDIGGTTTDIGLVLGGSPLLSFKGAQIDNFLTHIRSLATRSITIGGDSTIINRNGEIIISNYRTGPAYCMGGNSPTPTDAMRYLNYIKIGSYQKAEEALAELLPENERQALTIRTLAESIIEQMVEKIILAIKQLLTEWKNEPAYKVWEVLHQNLDYKFNIYLSGGPAAGLAKTFENKMKTRAIISNWAPISNAVGAAMAKPTFSWTLNLDTSLAKYRIEETGEQGAWKGAKRPYREVEKFLVDISKEQALEMGIDFDSFKIEPFEYFPLVDNHRTIGQIVRGSVHLPPGVIGRIL